MKKKCVRRYFFDKIYDTHVCIYYLWIEDSSYLNICL